MKTFTANDTIEGLSPCTKKEVIVYAMEIFEDFRVTLPDGSYQYGKSGDYLIKSHDGSLSVCEKNQFETTYEGV